MPDYRRACACAYGALARAPRPVFFPLDLNTLISAYPDIGLLSYSEFCQTHSLSITEAVLQLGSEHGSSFSIDGKTIICFNDLYKNRGAVRFTCAHELGHALLAHLDDKAELSPERYGVLEKEANCFARNLLMPHTAVARALSLGAGGAGLSILFGVSRQAAALRLRFLETDAALSGGKLGEFFFSAGRICQRCGEIACDGEYCSYCGEPLESSAINLSLEKSRASAHNECIMCGRSLTPGVSCPFCGFPALNACPACASALEFGALYCHACGGKSLHNILSTQL